MVSLRSYMGLEWVSLKRDPSTGLGTLISLFERLEYFLQSTWASSDPLSLLHVDIDQLNRLNHSFGMTIVDEMITHMVQEVQRLLEEAKLGFPPDELLYRIGGDEFALVLPRVSAEGAVEFAEKIRQRWAEGSASQATHSATVSIGVATVPSNAHDLGSLITAADMGVLASKRKGGNAVSVQDAHPMDSYEVVVASRIINMLARRMVETGNLLEEAQQAAYTDPVSGLPNQRAMNHFLDQEHRRAARYNRPYSILLVDGDSLKKFNDTLSHEAGNEWIRRLSRLLVRQTRATDLVARWFSGDEFVIVLPETEADQAFHTAERIREAVETEGREMAVAGTVSIGVATYPDDGVTVNEILDRADIANGLAKRAGRNCVKDYRSTRREHSS